MKFKIKPVKEMSMEEKIGQLVMCGFLGKELSDVDIALIKKYKVGNFILFSRNYEDTAQIKKLMKELYKIVMEETGSFPLVSIDQEGGMVTRLFKDVTFPASPLTTSATAYPNAPYITGKIIGSDMLTLGINLNLAPCLEINEGLKSPLVSVRSYGANKYIVTQNVSAFIRGLHDGGVLSCIKHFPGAGNSKKDSHLELPIIEESIEQLVDNNMYPFLHNLDSDALMSSHCLFASFDDVPTTLSRKLLTDTLRNKYGYNGLIITDGMEMKAIYDHYGMTKGSIMALNAGCDILLVCHDLPYQIESLEAVKKGLYSGELNIDEINEKLERINKAKEKLLPYLNSSLDFDEEYIIKNEEHEVMQQIVDESFTLIKGSTPVLTPNTVILAPEVKVASIVEDEFEERNLKAALAKYFKETPVYKLEEFSESQIDVKKNYIIYSYDVSRNMYQLPIINKILEKCPESFVVSLKGPMDEDLFIGLKNYSCLYEYTPNSIRTVVKELKGELKLLGHLPK